MIALIDGDIIAYKCAAAVEPTWSVATYIDKEFDETTEMKFRYVSDMKSWQVDNPSFELVGEVVKEVRLGPLSAACASADSMLATIERNVEADELKIFLTGEDNYRHDVVEPLRLYKGNRKDVAKPTHLSKVKEYLVSKHGAIWSENEEADDMLGYTQYEGFDLDTIICSIDKDLLMIPGYHYNITKEDITFVSEEDGDLFFWKQMLTGDTTDNIPGLKGVGAKRADALIEDCFADIPTVQVETEKLYQKEFGKEWERRINEMATLLWIRRERGQMKRIA